MIVTVQNGYQAETACVLGIFHVWDRFIFFLFKQPFFPYHCCAMFENEFCAACFGFLGCLASSGIASNSNLCCVL